MASEVRWEPIIPYLNEFNSHLADHVPKLRLEAANDRRWSNQRYLEQCRTGTFNNYGVYLIFSPDELLQYVGLAMNRFHNRIWSHDEHVNRQWTDIIPLPHRYYWLAPALEFFLIVRLQPPKNSVYRSYTIPAEVVELGDALPQAPIIEQAPGDLDPADS